MKGQGDDGIEFGSLRESDFVEISRLITRMGSRDTGQRLRDKSEKYYRWMYAANPSGSAIVHSARNGETVVSSFAMAPKTFQIDGREVVIGKTMDMFTDPSYQGRGLIKKCTEAVFKEAARAEIGTWYVTPSVNSYPIFKNRWGYREDLELIFRSKIIDYSKILEMTMKPTRLGRVLGNTIDTASATFRHTFGLPTGYEKVAIKEFGPDVDQLWKNIAPGYRVALVRNANYLNWRYVDNPDSYFTYGLLRHGQLVGLIVLRTTLRRGVEVGEIMDYLCPANEPKTLGLLIRIASDEFRHRGCALVQAWSIKATRHDHLLKRSGLPLSRSGVKFLISPDSAYAAVYDPEAWLLTQGDGNDT